jgi:hypothetical protein
VLGKEFFVAKTVLQCEQSRPVVQKWGNEIDKVSVRCCLDSDDDQIARPNFLRRVVTIYVHDPETAAFSANVEAVPPDFAQIATHQKMHVAPSMGQMRTVMDADCSGTNNGGPHFYFRRAAVARIESCV